MGGFGRGCRGNFELRQASFERCFFPIPLLRGDAAPQAAREGGGRPRCGVPPEQGHRHGGGWGYPMGDAPPPEPPAPPVCMHAFERVPSPHSRRRYWRMHSRPCRRRSPCPKVRVHACCADTCVCVCVLRVSRASVFTYMQPTPPLACSPGKEQRPRHHQEEHVTEE